MKLIIALITFLTASLMYPGYTTPEYKHGLGHASICCPNDCKIEFITEPDGIKMNPVCKIKKNECSKVTATKNKACECMCMEDEDTMTLVPVCYCREVF